MPLLGNSPQQSAERDDLDDLFNYDVSMDDVFKDSNASDAAPKDQSELRRRNSDNGAGLGLDEEIKITKRRQPIAKLDEARLLSSAGIPKLQKITKERLKFRGKGHEFSDVSRLLNTYQLWLDDLYPRAKFADGLAIIEKLGHKKTMQMKRKEWIDESKPRPIYEDAPKITMASEETNAADDQQEDNVVPERVAEETLPNQEQDDTPNQEHDSTSGPLSNPEVNEEDDLDALLAEDAAAGSTSRAEGSTSNVAPQDNFEDEMEAMADLNDPW